MALVTKSKTLSNIFEKGTIGEISRNIGIGAVINFIDSKTGGHLKGVNVSMGKTVNGQPLSLNLTDGLFVMTTTGLNFSGKGLINTLISLAGKKGAEAFGIIMDDPLPLRTNWPQLDTHSPQTPMIVMQSHGGNYH